jgi:hypothetical protein
VIENRQQLERELQKLPTATRDVIRYVLDVLEDEFEKALFTTGSEEEDEDADD